MLPRAKWGVCKTFMGRSKQEVRKWLLSFMRCDHIEVNTEVFSAKPCGPLPLAHISNFKTCFVTLLVVVNAVPVTVPPLSLVSLVSFADTGMFGVTDVVDDEDDDVVERDADGKDCSDETDETEGADSTEGADGGADGAGGFVLLVEALLLVLFLSVCVPSEVVLNDFFIDVTSSVGSTSSSSSTDMIHRFITHIHSMSRVVCRQANETDMSIGNAPFRCAIQRFLLLLFSSCSLHSLQVMAFVAFPSSSPRLLLLSTLVVWWRIDCTCAVPVISITPSTQN